MKCRGKKNSPDERIVLYLLGTDHIEDQIGKFKEHRLIV